MKTTSDYHIHSTYSKNNHGKSTIEEIVQQAVLLGLKEIAITDHGPGHFLYGIRADKIAVAKSEIINLRKKYPQIKILFGVEANILNYDGDTDINEDLLKSCDIILCGFHLGAKFSTFKDFWGFIVLNYLGRFNKNLKEHMTNKNTEAVVNALNKYDIKILTHPGDKMPVDIEKIARAAEKNNTILEISNHHDHLTSDEIKIAAKYKVRFVISSDAHIKENIGKFEKALNEAVKAKLNLKRIINLSEGE
jgi:putative hydrolase